MPSPITRLGSIITTLNLSRSELLSAGVQWCPIFYQITSPIPNRFSLRNASFHRTPKVLTGGREEIGSPADILYWIYYCPNTSDLPHECGKAPRFYRMNGIIHASHFEFNEWPALFGQITVNHYARFILDYKPSMWRTKRQKQDVRRRTVMYICLWQCRPVSCICIGFRSFRKSISLYSKVFEDTYLPPPELSAAERRGIFYTGQLYDANQM